MNKDKKRSGASVALQIFVGVASAVVAIAIGPSLLGLIFLSFLVAMYLQIIIHEAGHLIFGIFTGYKFSSFRIGSFMWQKEQDKVRLKRLSIAGTGGQCLMSPPELVDGKIPFVLYNFGGVILNTAAFVLFFVSSVLCKGIPYLAFFFLIVGVVGLMYALLNGIPLRLSTINNDGYNTISIGKNDEAQRAFWIQLSVQSQIAKGHRLKDLSDEWLFIPSDDGMNNSIIATIGALQCNQLMDMHAFEEAYQLMNTLINMDSAMVGLHRYLLNCDRIYCELIGENRSDRLEYIFDTQQKKFMNSMKNSPTVLRTEYAYTVIVEKDIKKAEKIELIFEKMAQKYPYQSDIESERELIQIVKNI